MDNHIYITVMKVHKSDLLWFMCEVITGLVSPPSNIKAVLDFLRLVYREVNCLLFSFGRNRTMYNFLPKKHDNTANELMMMATAMVAFCISWVDSVVM